MTRKFVLVPIMLALALVAGAGYFVRQGSDELGGPFLP